MATGAAAASEDRRADLVRRTAAAASAAGVEVSLAALERALARLPRISGRAIRVRFVRDPHVHRGRLFAGGIRGVAVHAGSHIRTRTIAFDRALLERPSELARIFVHELFHFVWIHLSNQERRDWETLLSCERGRGELGWSAEMRKTDLNPSDRPNRTRRWREYACESFCDTAAWLFAGAARHEEFTLSAHWRERRKRWLGRFLGNALEV